MCRIIFAIILLVAPVLGADTSTPLESGQGESGPTSLRLTGPSEANAGQSVTIIVHGLPSVDLTQTVGDQTAWVETLRFAVSAPDGAEVVLDKELSMTVAPWGWRLRVSFVPPADGIYVLVCDWNQEPFGLALHRILVGPRPPPPDPPPPPPPPPGRVARVVIVEESGDRTPEEAAILTDPRLKPLRDQRKLLILDQHAADSQGQPASELSQYDGQPLPRVIGLDSSGVRSVASELPGSADGLMELLRTWGVL